MWIGRCTPCDLPLCLYASSHMDFDADGQYLMFKKPEESRPFAYHFVFPTQNPCPRVWAFHLAHFLNHHLVAWNIDWPKISMLRVRIYPPSTNNRQTFTPDVSKSNRRRYVSMTPPSAARPARTESGLHVVAPTRNTLHFVADVTMQYNDSGKQIVSRHESNRVPEVFN